MGTEATDGCWKEFRSNYLLESVSKGMSWGDVASLRPVKKELERILSFPPTDSRPWSQNIRAATNAEKMTLLESVIMEMLRGDGAGMTAGARRELLWRDFLFSASNLFGPLPAQGLVRDADYAFTSGIMVYVVFLTNL